MSAGDARGPIDLGTVWEALEGWDQERPKSYQLTTCRAQFYMGAMEIPMVAFRPPRSVDPEEERVAAFVPTLRRFGLELDPVEIGRNYKLNRSAAGEYVGRILPDALKLHAERILDLGRDAFEEIVTLYLSLPVAEADAG